MVPPPRVHPLRYYGVWAPHAADRPSEAGYTCGLAGKLHLSTCAPVACPDTERRIDDGYADFHWSHHPRPDWPTNEYGVWLKSRGVERRLCRAAYWSMCDLIDAQVGRLLAALEASGQADDTIVIFMSDHGEMLGDHGLYYKGPYFYEPAVHVPLIVRWPARIRPGRSRALVELQDLAPALLGAAGLERHPGMQARSLLLLLTGEADPDHHQDDVYSEYYHGMQARTKPGPFATMLRDERYKLVVAHGLEVGELYDLESDPGETYNLWATPAHQERKLSLLKRLCDRMAFTCDPLPERLGNY